MNDHTTEAKGKQYHRPHLTHWQSTNTDGAFISGSALGICSTAGDAAPELWP